MIPIYLQITLVVSYNWKIITLNGITADDENGGGTDLYCLTTSNLGQFYRKHK